MWTIWQKLMFGVGSLLVLFAVFLLVAPDSRKTQLMKRLDTEGMVAQAKVFDKHVEEYTSYSDSGSRSGRRSIGVIIRDHNRRADSATTEYLYFVDVEFKSARGETIKSRQNILGRQFDFVEIGAELPILYHPADPALASRLIEHAPRAPDIDGLYRIMALFSLAVAAILLFAGRPRGTAQETDSESEWQKAAVVRITSARAAKSMPTEPTTHSTTRRLPARRAAPAKSFGQTRRVAKI